MINASFFFSNSDLLDYMVLRPLSHIMPNWELRRGDGDGLFLEEEDSFAGLFNQLIDELEKVTPPLRYHDHEDRLAEFVKERFKKDLKKIGMRWEGEDYRIILQDGGFGDADQKDMVLAVAGRIKAAIDRKQLQFDDMEKSHRYMLAVILTLILYHRADEYKSMK
jgi:hypothetical protein